MTRSAAEVKQALDLATEGRNNCEISRLLGIPRGTVRDWVSGAVPKRGSAARAGECLACAPAGRSWLLLYEQSYAYLLGLYLGDGTISVGHRGVHRLRIFLDRKYPVIVQEALAAIALINPGDTASTYSHTDCKMEEVSGWSKHWPHLFPQHGPGMKHLRPIRLEPWQQRIVEAHPGRLLRGLIHSDGCRVQNVIRHPKKVYSYPRYFFSNRSGDIKGIFTDACDLLGVRWRQDGPQNISVARRDSVAVLDLHVGPKR